MTKHLIRPACAQDIPALCSVKSRYVRALYRGFLSSEHLKQLVEGHFLEQITAWIAGEFQVDVLEQDGQVTGYIAYGKDPEDEHYGFIYEVGLIPSESWQKKDLLMRRCLEHLSQAHDVVRTKTLKDNFHTRFIFEQFGFHPDGTLETRTIHGDELRIIRL